MLLQDTVKDDSLLDPIEIGILKHAKAANERWNAYERGRSNVTSSLTISRKRKAGT